MKRIIIPLVMLFVLLSLSISTVGAAGVSQTLKAHSAANAVASLPTAFAYGGYSTSTGHSNTGTVGPFASVGLACNPVPTTVSSAANLTSLGSLVSSGTVASTITTSSTTTSNHVAASSEVKNLSLLGGLISASAIHAEADSTATASGGISFNNSAFTGLIIAGLPIQLKPAPNTKLNLPQVGYVVVNEQSVPINGPTMTKISVNALDIYVTLGSAAGTHIVISHADSSETITPQRLIVTAKAYGMYGYGPAGALTTSSSPMGAVALSCTGGSDQVSSNGFSSDPVGTEGSVTSSVSGEITPTDANAQAQTNVTSANLLSGRIQLGNMTLHASSDFANGTGTRSGSMALGSGSIAGVALSRNPPPNTRIDLPGLGYVIVNEQSGSNSSTGAYEQVIGFDIYITVSNKLGLPVGARIIVGAAYAKTSSY